MNLSIVTWDDKFVSIQVDASTPVADVKAILEAETAVPIAQQALVHGGKVLMDMDTLGACNVADGDVLQMLPAQAVAQQARARAGAVAAASGSGGGGAGTMNADGSANNPIALMQDIRSNPHMLASLKENNPQLAKAIEDDDVSTFQERLKDLQRDKAEREAAMQKWYRMAEEQPYNIEVQQKIEELIREQNIQESYHNALEHTPEMVVGQVHMLYVNMEVNGVKVKAFVDSGAQMTIMTQEFAERCYLTRLIDKRFHGVARGVGESRIVGRIHQAPMKVGGQHIQTSITVLEQKSGPQFIFGLDNLKRHLCCIDLRNNKLQFGTCDASLPFLSESEIPSDFGDMVDSVSEADAKRNMEAGEGAGASASAPSGQASTPIAPPSAGAAGGAAPAADDKLAKLMSLGFPREQCEAALKMAGGNEEYAAAMLFEQMG